jgi:hypothetical protein
MKLELSPAAAASIFTKKPSRGGEVLDSITFGGPLWTLEQILRFS